MHAFSISIPYGAIKRNNEYVSVKDNGTFQFLMVRLKVYLFMRIGADPIISIPYGAIKSFHNFIFFGVNFISIPYGAIKRLVDNNGNDIESIFQFLMVRLKELLIIRLVTHLYIFQFLMVRLKVPTAIVYIFCEADFNSLWCD